MMEDLTIKCSEVPNPSLVAISTNSSPPVNYYATTLSMISNSTCPRSSQRTDAYIKGLINCEFCPKTSTTRGQYKHVFLFFLDPSLGLTASILAAMVKPIPDHTLAIPAAKGLG
jgi:hypothetical protein